MNWKRILLVTTQGFVLLASANLAKLGVLVVDEVTGKPIRDVRVVGIFCNSPTIFSLRTPDSNVDEAVTDSNGRCRVWGRTNNGQAGCYVQTCPSGYYGFDAGGGYEFRRRNLLGIWQPDNIVVTIRLQRVERPIPLLKKRVARGDWSSGDFIAKSGGRLRFDFMVGDWLPPVGKGRVADVEFTRLPHEDLGEAENEVAKGRSFRDSMAVKFLGSDNGLVERRPLNRQVLKIRTAPEDGYRADYLCWKGQDEKLRWQSSYDEKRCFCFRIRTRRNDRGEIVEAYYGKIYGDFLIETKSNPYVPVASAQFRYYLNPTPLDRNLEWDRKTNLFTPDKRIYNPNDEQP